MRDLARTREECAIEGRDSKEKGGVGFIIAYGRSGDVAEERVCETSGGIGTTPERFRLFRKHIRIDEQGVVIVVMRTCLMLVVDESVDRLMHNLRTVKSLTNIEICRSLGFGVEPE